MTTTIETPAYAVRDSQPDPVDELVTVARSLAPLVESEAEQSAHDGITTGKVIRAWKDAGLYHLLLPARFGGRGLDNVSYLQVAEEIARQDASAGWTFAIHQLGSTCLGIVLAEETFVEFVGPDRDGIACGFGLGMPRGTAKRVDGGYLVKSDPMPFGSGTQHATRVTATLFLVDDNDEKVIGDDGNPVVVTSCVDPSHVEWLNDWNASGLRGSGSGHYRVKEHVLDEKWLSTSPGKRADDPVFRQGFWALTNLHHAAVALGISNRAIQELTISTKDRRRGEIPALDQYPLFQDEFVRIESEYQAARTLVHRAFQDIWEAATKGSQNDLHLARVEQAVLHLYRVLGDIVTTASLWAGSDVIPKDSVFARLNADTAVARNHLYISPHQTVKIAPQLLEAWENTKTTQA